MHINEQTDSVLPKPNSLLSTVVPDSTIAAANKAVKKVIDSDTWPSEEDTICSSCCGAYKNFIPKDKSLHLEEGSGGVTATIHFFSKAFPVHPLNDHGDEVTNSRHCAI